MCQQLPPCSLPSELAPLGIVFRLKEYADLVSSAVFCGIWLTVPQLKQLVLSRNFQPPRSGSGKSGRVIKVDWARVLVEGLHSTASDKDKKRMLAATLGKSEKQVGLDALGMVAMLDPENAEGFKEIKKAAMEGFEKSLKTRSMNSKSSTRLRTS